MRIVVAGRDLLMEVAGCRFMWRRRHRFTIGRASRAGVRSRDPVSCCGQRRSVNTFFGSLKRSLVNRPDS